MNPNDDLGSLGARDRWALMGALAVCCVLPMLAIFGVLSLATTLIGGTVAVVVGAAAIVGWGAWMGRHHRHSGHQDPHPPGDDPVA